MPEPLTRRDALIALAATAWVGCTSEGAEDACAPATGPQTAGPFYPGEPPVRMDIRGDRTGVALDLTLVVITAEGCDPVVDAEVDVWNADAAGAYSGYPDFGTEDEGWLRGQQRTDTEGTARFTTLVPGAYPGRAVHLHVKVRPVDGGELTTQVYLPDALVAEVLEQADYVESAVQVRNDDDNFYADDTLLEASGDATNGVQAIATLVV